MAPVYLVLALVIQCSFIHADTDISEENEDLREVLQRPDIYDGSKPSTNWFDMLIFPKNDSMFPSSSASMLTEIMNSNKTFEEQLNDIKELEKQIATEMDNLFSDVIDKEKEIDENGARKKRSVETPMDSSKMIMRLLNHIKSNNEYQNIAIDKMMSAQEIAEKFGIEFNPDPEILSDLAVAANEHAQEMTNMLKDACTLKNITIDKVNFVPIVDEPKNQSKTYYTYDVQPESEPGFEFLPDIVSKPNPANHIHYNDPFPYYTHESQANPHSVHHHHSAPVTPRPSLYDPFVYTPASDYHNLFGSVEPVLMVPIEEQESEPELVGEEVEETITSKMIVEKGDDLGATTVNHVTTYTISEKSHFKPPQIEQLPQHFQYCFFLM